MEDGLVSGGKGLVQRGRTGFGWFQGGKDWFWLVSGWEGLVSGGFMWEGLVSGGFGSFHFLVTTTNSSVILLMNGVQVHSVFWIPSIKHFCLSPDIIRNGSV